jgi:hypothetical protein
MMHVILGAAKDLSLAVSSQGCPEILRGAQDDIWRQVWNGVLQFRRLKRPGRNFFFDRFVAFAPAEE